MSKPRPRKTRTITFRGGPDDGIVGQHPHGYEEIRANTIFRDGEPVGWDEYLGPGGAGAAEFRFTRHVGEAPETEDVTAVPTARVYIAPAGTPLPIPEDLRSGSGAWQSLPDGFRDMGFITDDGVIESTITAEPHSSRTGTGMAVDVARAAAREPRGHA